MSVILHLDTATENATISIAQDEEVIYSLTNSRQKDHAAFLQPGIKQLFTHSNITIKQLEAVAVTAGPGSYTGLRVAMASAKGLCYALQIPLITLSTLEVMALSVIQNTPEPASYLYCPMIDARRMEVFTALFDHRLNQMLPASAMVLEPGSFDEFIKKRPIIFCGSGSEKFIYLSLHTNLIYKNIPDSASALARLSIKCFHKKDFADLVHAEPVYLKQFYSGSEL